MAKTHEKQTFRPDDVRADRQLLDSLKAEHASLSRSLGDRPHDEKNPAMQRKAVIEQEMKDLQKKLGGADDKPTAAGE